MMAPMELTDRVAVVTGGASGIGRALAWRLAEEGARGVVVADLDEPGAQAVADGIGARALAVGCDVSDEHQVVDLVARAEDAFGPVDLFCANAGVAVGTDLDTPEEAWELALRRQRPRARLRRQGARARMARARRGLLPRHGLGGRPAHADRLGARTR